MLVPKHSVLSYWGGGEAEAFGELPPPQKKKHMLCVILNYILMEFRMKLAMRMHDCGRHFLPTILDRPLIMY